MGLKFTREQLKKLTDRQGQGNKASSKPRGREGESKKRERCRYCGEAVIFDRLPLAIVTVHGPFCNHHHYAAWWENDAVDHEPDED